MSIERFARMIQLYGSHAALLTYIYMYRYICQIYIYMSTYFCILRSSSQILRTPNDPMRILNSATTGLLCELHEFAGLTIMATCSKESHLVHRLCSNKNDNLGLLYFLETKSFWWNLNVSPHFMVNDHPNPMKFHGRFFDSPFFCAKEDRILPERWKIRDVHRKNHWDFSW